MSLQLKYREALMYAQQIGAQNTTIAEENGILKVTGTVETQYEKDKFWDKLKAAGGETPHDVHADIRVTNTSYYGIHVVKRGDTLSKIAKDVYGDMMKYHKIFEANRSILRSPDRIKVGQELVIPF